MGASSPQRTPAAVNIYLAQVKQLIQEAKQLGLVEKITGPTLYQHEKNWSVLLNVYPLHQAKTDALVQRVIRTARQIATEFIGEKGEIIAAQVGTGEIRDQGQPYFEITRGQIFECYHYDFEAFAYIRVFQENKLAENESWISLDMDLLEKSAWFTEKLNGINSCK
jgi:hypothetical protein